MSIKCYSSHNFMIAEGVLCSFNVIFYSKTAKYSSERVLILLGNMALYNSSKMSIVDFEAGKHYFGHLSNGSPSFII